ncbi:restriction endonuclease [Psychrobacter sp. I-STPA10]|uniref:restriction endonuclease n=1 Tax=Psychrobacter sp. I-STPA10 TaxID=2585769 RepID=UPI001E334FFD|nr:restriction endonuclease [Psychrobacter sp. I-STPA10]
MTQTTMPPFGDIFNAGIQTVKQLCNRSNGITSHAFHKKLDELLSITDKQKEMCFINPELAIYADGEEDEMLDECYSSLTDLLVLCLVAIGAVKSEVFKLEPNVGQTFAHLIPFDKTITPDNLIEIDPFGKIYFWMAGDNFFHYHHADVPSSTYEANLDRFDAKSFRVLKALNKASYGVEGDSLINHLIKETMRRTSVFMNNYADVITANDHVKVTPEMILHEIYQLTPLQFEYLCLKVVETSLKREDDSSDTPNSIIKSKHTGQTNDGGIDGIVTQQCADGEEHTYYIQAKQYQEGNNISNSALRNFVGGYPPKNQHHHGIFITTSDFTRNAQKYADELDSHSLILVNQMALLDLMIEHEIGLEKIQTETLVMDKQFFKQIRKK